MLQRFLRNITPYLLGFISILGVALMFLGLETGWTIAQLNAAAGLPVITCAPTIRVWELGISLVFIAILFQQLLRR